MREKYTEAGEALRNLRESQGGPSTTERLRDFSPGMGRSTVYDVEAGKGFNWENLPNIANFYGITIGELISIYGTFYPEYRDDPENILNPVLEIGKKVLQLSGVRQNTGVDFINFLVKEDEKYRVVEEISEVKIPGQSEGDLIEIVPYESVL